MELLNDYNAFGQIKIIGNSVGWPNIGVYLNQLYH